VAVVKPSRVGAWTVLGIIVVYYAVPMIAMTRFAFQRIPVIKLTPANIFDKWTAAPLFETLADPGFRAATGWSIALSIATAILTIVLLVPTMTYAHLNSPRARKMIELSAILPFVVPAIALVIGFAGAFRGVAPVLLRNTYGLVPLYVITALPYTHRALESGLAALDVRTLVDASRSLGASWPRTMLSVIAPNMRPSIATATFLSLTVVFGEFTIASLLLRNTLPLYLAYAQPSDPQGALAVGLVLTLVTTVFVALSNRFGKTVRS
jgi:putative spermidine/putrescine transport system permease protein